jgi:hypothetical protein
LIEPGRNTWNIDAAVAIGLGPGLVGRLAAGGQFGDNGVSQLWGRAGVELKL